MPFISRSAQEHLMQNAELYSSAGIDVTDPESIPFFLRPSQTLKILGMTTGSMPKVRPQLFRAEMPGSGQEHRETRTHRYPFLSTVLLGDRLRGNPEPRLEVVRAFAGSLAARPLFDMIQHEFIKRLTDVSVEAGGGALVKKDDVQGLLSVGGNTITEWVNNGSLTSAYGATGRLLFRDEIIDGVAFHLPTDLSEQALEIEVES